MPHRIANRVFLRMARRGKTAFILLLAMKVAAIALLAVSLYEARRASAERRVAYEAMVSLDQLISTLRDAETGQRGYLLTGKASYLEPYDRAVVTFSERLAVVRLYRPFSTHQVDLIDRLARDKFAELATTIRLRHDGQFTAAMDIVYTDHGKRTMDAIRSVIYDMRDDERRRVDRATARIGMTVILCFAGFVAMTGLTAVTLVGLIVAYSREETARVEAEDASERAASRYAAIHRAAPTAVITADPDGLIDSWNPAAERTFGWSAAEIHRKPVQLLVPERIRRTHTAAVTEAFRTGGLAKPGQPWETWGLRKDGSEFPAELFVDVFQIDEGLHSIAMVRDISPRRHMEARQEELRQELERSNHELQQFAYVASHDLQEPLRMVDKFVGLLAEKYKGRLDEQADKYIGHIQGGARRMRALIEDLLHYSRVTTRALPFESVDLSVLCAEITRDLADLIEREGGVVRLATEMPVIVGEAFQLRQLFQNLVANGLKFHRPGVPPVVTIACSGAVDEPACRGGPPCWHIAVSDNGIGIDPSQSQKLFQLFTRLHPRGEFEGTGIGLAICKKIVERHGGRIWIQSTPGDGSTFHFTFPKNPGEGNADRRQTTENPAGRG
jgi:PAS domain S-box-containing protein